MLENIPSLVRSAGTNLSPNELLAQALDVLQGVSADAASALESIDIRTIFDLGASSIFFTAMRITEAAQADTEFARVGKLPADIVDDTTVALLDVPNRDIGFLKALDEIKANTLKSALFVTSIRDLALWPPYHAAVRIVNEVYGGASGITEDPEMPQELVPRMGKLPTERVQYEVVIFDQVMDDSIIPQLGSGSTGTPSTTTGGGGLIVVDPNERDRPYDHIDIPGGSNIYPLRSSIPSAGESRPNVPSLTEEMRSLSERTILASLSAPAAASAPSAPPATSYTPIEQAGQLDLSKLSQAIGFTKPALGAVLTMTQSWYTHGLSLGQLLHTIALGPGESTRIAMIDWARKSKGEGKQSILESEELDSTLSRSRAISEVTNSVARESQQGFSESKNEGFSVGASHSGSFTGSWGGMGFSAGHTIGTQYSTGYASSSAFSSGERSLSASMTQNVLDTTHQASNLARNRRATMVQEVSQEESEKISTRALTNYNHMHALSIQYYEIVQLYKVVVEVSRVTPCLFIPIKHLTFTDPTVLRKFRRQIVTAALEPSVRMLTKGEPDTATFRVPHLSETWDYPNQRWLLDLLRGQLNYEPLTSDPKTILLLLRQYPTKIRFSARIRNRPGAAPAPIPSGLFEQLVVVFTDGTTAEIPFTSGSIGDFDLSAWSAVDLLDNRVVSRFWQAKAIYVVMKADDWTSDLERSVGVSIAFRQSPDWVAKYGQSANDDPEAFVYSFRINIPEADRGDLPDERKHSFAIAEIEAFPTTHQIMDHLEDNTMYYSQAIWSGLDSTSLSLLLSGYSFAGRPIAEMIDPTPVSAVGNYLVFRFYGAEKTSWWRNFVEKKGANLNERKEDLVPMPSGGVFAEAVLGRFNSAEKLDLTRYWDWQDSPIPITAPEISAISAAGRAQQDGIKIDLGDLKPATLNLTVPPAIPDPTGMTAALNAVANGNMFRDMSGLAANIAAAQAAMQTNAAGAQKFAELANEAAKISANLMGAKLNAAEKLDKENEDKGKQSEGQNNREKVLNPESNGTSGGETGGSGKIGRPQEYIPDPDEEWGLPPFPTLSDPPLVPAPDRSKPTKTPTKGRPFVIAAHWKGTNTPVEGTYDIGVQDQATQASASNTFIIRIGTGVGTKIISLPSGTWVVNGRVLIEKVPRYLSQVPVTVIDGLASINLNVDNLQLGSWDPIAISTIITVTDTQKSVQLELTPVIEETSIEREFSLRAEATGTGTYQAQVEASLEGEVNAFVERAKAGGKVSSGASVTLSGTLGVGEIIRAKITTRLVVGFSIERIEG